MSDGNFLECPVMSSAHAKSDAGGSQIGEKYEEWLKKLTIAFFLKQNLLLQL